MASILVIEDGLVRSLDLQAALHRNGHTVCGITREHAVCFAAKWRPDFVIMDQTLHGLFDAMTAGQPCACPAGERIEVLPPGAIAVRLDILRAALDS